MGDDAAPKGCGGWRKKDANNFSMMHMSGEGVAFREGAAAPQSM